MSGGNILAEADGSGNLTAEYVFFGGKRLVRIDLPANTVHYYLSDHIGSTSKVVNSAGVAEGSRITARELQIAIPKGSMSPAQQEVFGAAAKRGAGLKNPVSLTVTEIR